jgi:Tol biopolymer transport system component
MLQFSDLASLDLQTGLSVMPAEGGSEVQAYSGEVNNVTWTPDGRLLFDRPRPDQPRGLSDLYAMRVVDGKPQGSPELVKKDVHLGNLQTVTPDGSYYYTQSGNAQSLYEMEMDPKTASRASEPKPIASSGAQTQGPSWSPDGEWLAYLSVGGTEKNALVIRSMKSGSERRFYPKGIDASAEAEQPGRRLQWFPDNRSLLLHYHSGELFRFDTRTGESRRVLENVKIPWNNQDSWWVAAVLAPDGRTLFYELPDDAKRIMRRDLNGGSEQEVCRIAGDRIHFFNVSPDGSRLALIVTYANGDPNEYRTLVTVAATGGEPKEVARPKGLARMLIWSKDGRYLIFNTRPEQQKNEMFSVSAEGGEPRPFAMKLHTVDFPTLSPDGKRMIFQDGGANRNELWALKIPQPNPKPSR